MIITAEGLKVNNARLDDLYEINDKMDKYININDGQISEVGECGGNV